MDHAVFAHQGGWDEALLVLVPIAVFVLLLGLANRRARAIQARRDADAAAPDAGPDDTTGTATDAPPTGPRP